MYTVIVSRKDPQNSNNSLCQHTTLVLKKKNSCSLCHPRAYVGSENIAKFGVSHCSKFRVAFAVALASLLAITFAVMMRSS